MSTPLNKLPLDTRLRLVEDLWDSIASEQGRIPLTPEQRDELDRRLDEFEADGDLGQSAELVLSDIRQGL